MKLPRFSAEDDNHPASLPTGKPATNAVLAAELSKMSGSAITEVAQQNLVLRAVHDFYFAKRMHRQHLRSDYEGDSRLERAASFVVSSMLRQAVVSIATTIDLVKSSSGNGGPLVGRTASLPHTIDRLVAPLAAMKDQDTAAAIELANWIKAQADPEGHPELKYVTHMRNKWAGHASLDLMFDDWEDGGTKLSIRYLESALVRVVNAFADLSELIELSQQLTDATARPEGRGRVDENGIEWIAMTVDWSSVTVMAEVSRNAAQEDAEYFFEMLARGTSSSRP